MIIARLHPRKALRAFGADSTGIAAVEFGMIAPIALVMMLGLIECGRALVMARRFALVTAVASDLVARSQTMSDTELDAIATSVNVLWRPYDPTALNFTMMQIRAAGPLATLKPPGQQYMDWGRQFVWTGAGSGHFVGSNLPPNCPNYTIAPNIIPPGGSAVLVTSNFTFAPLFTRTPMTANIMCPITWRRKSPET